MLKNKKANKVCKSFSGEYNGIHFEIVKQKTDKKVEYIYKDGDVSDRRLDKKRYKNLIRNSEVLHDDIKEKYIRFYDW